MKKQDVKKFLARTDLVVEGNTATWQIHATGPIHGTYTGLFRFKCFLTPSEKLAAGRTYRDLLGPNASLAFTNEDNLAFSLAQLKYRVLESPPFWSSAVGIGGLPGDVADQNIIDLVLEAAISSENKYLAQIQERKDAALKNAKKAAEALLNKKDEKAKKEEDEGEEG